MKKQINWNNKMFKKTIFSKIFWLLDKRLFRWDHLPSLAKIQFVQKSYLLLLIIPLIDQFLSPMLTLPKETYIELNLGWIYLIPGEMKISFELGMPFSWQLIYYMVLFLGLGSAITEIFAPRIIGQTNIVKVTRQLVMQNFREVANGITFASRANHFLYDFSIRYTKNFEELSSISSDDINKAKEVKEKLLPIQKQQSNTRVNQYSIYYIAEHMELKEDKLDDAMETIVWFLNETKFFARWFSGICFLISIAIFIALVSQGLIRMF